MPNADSARGFNESLFQRLFSKIDSSSRRVTSPFFSKNFRIIAIAGLYNSIIESENLQNSKKFSKIGPNFRILAISFSAVPKIGNFTLFAHTNWLVRAGTSWYELEPAGQYCLPIQIGWYELVRAGTVPDRTKVQQAYPVHVPRSTGKDDGARSRNRDSLDLRRRRRRRRRDEKRRRVRRGKRTNEGWRRRRRRRRRRRCGTKVAVKRRGR